MRKPAENVTPPSPLEGADRRKPSEPVEGHGSSIEGLVNSVDREVKRPTPASPRLETTAASAVSVSENEANLNDAWLVERARHGDHAAFAVLVRRYERKLIRVLARLVRDPEQARDLAQETFWRVYSRLDRFDSARRFGPWLFRVGVNLGLDQLRRTKNEPRRRPPSTATSTTGGRRSTRPIRIREFKRSWPRRFSSSSRRCPFRTARFWSSAI